MSARDPRVPAWRDAADKEWEANRMATYAAMVEHLDLGVGQILQALKDYGAEKNTLVIFFSDNGGCAEVVEPNWYDVPSRTRDGKRIVVGDKHHSVFAGPEDVSSRKKFERVSGRAKLEGDGVESLSWFELIQPDLDDSIAVLGGELADVEADAGWKDPDAAGATACVAKFAKG